MQNIIINIMENFGYLGILFLVTLENVFPPIPSEVILLFGGFITTKSSLSIQGVLLFSTLGSLIGAFILYVIGMSISQERLLEMTRGKMGHILRLKESDLHKTFLWFSEKGTLTVFFCRFIPILRSLISLPAGINKMPFGKFLLYTILGSFIWNLLLIYMGYIAGHNWPKVVMIFNKCSLVLKVIMGIIIILIVINFYRKKRSEL